MIIQGFFSSLRFAYMYMTHNILEILKKGWGFMIHVTKIAHS